MSDEARERMVSTQIAGRVRDARVVDAMRAVPRERFVEERLEGHAYDDRPLPIGEGQTISQPLVVALMIEAARLKPGDRVLEVGAGSGYAAAVMSLVAGRVYALERLPALADRATERLKTLGYDNVELVAGDGTRGWPEVAPFDAIVVSAGAEAVPAALKNQLAIGGTLVIPVGSRNDIQRLLRVVRVDEETFSEEDLGGVAFVPLVGDT